jgi:hypothetical protein
MLAAQSVPPLLQALIPLALGLWATLTGFGIVPASMDEKKAATWKKRNATSYQIGGPILMVVGAVLLWRGGVH